MVRVRQQQRQRQRRLTHDVPPLYVPPRPARSPARPLAALTLACVVLTSCSSSDTTAPAPPGTPKTDTVNAAALAALATTRTPTGLPPATVTTEQTAAVLTATQPTTPGGVGRFDADQVKTALAFAAQVVAATRADRDYLCGPVSADPLAGLSTPGLAAFLADPANKDNKRAIEQPISGANNDQNCGPLQWAGPGVVPGPQTWQATPGKDGADLTVEWEGTAGYVLVDGDGNAEPWGLTARGVYGLVQTADGWLLDSWDGTTFGSLDQGWPHDIPIPDGYLPTAGPPASDPDALDAVRATPTRGNSNRRRE